MIQLQIHSNSHVDYNNRNASGLYEIIDRKHPSWSQDVEENSPQLLSIPGFFHLISWKKLPSYRTNKSGIFLKTLAVLTHSEEKIPLESISWNILISCHDIYFMNQESLNYLFLVVLLLGLMLKCLGPYHLCNYFLELFSNCG